MTVFAVGGMANHIHILFRLPRAISLVRAVTLIESNSSKWMKQTKKTFAWQEGYGAFSVSSSNVSAVIRYIDMQEFQHKKKGFGRRIYCVVEETRRGLRSEICF